MFLNYAGLLAFLLFIMNFSIISMQRDDRDPMFNDTFYMQKFLAGDMPINDSIDKAHLEVTNHRNGFFFFRVLTGQLSISMVLNYFKQLNKYRPRELRAFALVMLEYGNQLGPDICENLLHAFKTPTCGVSVSNAIRSIVYPPSWEPLDFDTLMARLELAAAMGDNATIKEILCPPIGWIAWLKSPLWALTDPREIEYRVRLVNSSHALTIAAAYGHVETVELLLSIGKGSEHIIKPNNALQRIGNLLTADKLLQMNSEKKYIWQRIAELLLAASEQWGSILGSPSQIRSRVVQRIPIDSLK